MTALAADDPRHGTTTGYSHKCRCDACRQAQSDANRRYREANAEKLKADNRRYRKANADALRKYMLRYRNENAEAAREYARTYRSANADAVKASRARRYEERAPSMQAYARARYKENAEAAREYARTYRSANADAVKASQRRYRKSPEGRAVHAAGRSRRRALEQDLDCGCVSKEALVTVWNEDDGRCYICDAPAEHYEHIVALANKPEPGWHCVANLRPACARCNLRKGWRRKLVDFVAILRGEGEEIRDGWDRSGLPCGAADTRATLAA